MLATALTTMTALEVVLFGENNVALFVVVKVPRFQIAPHVANLPRMKSMPDYKTERVTWSAAEAAGVELWVRRLDAVDSPAPGNNLWDPFCKICKFTSSWNMMCCAGMRAYPIFLLCA